MVEPKFRPKLLLFLYIIVTIDLVFYPRPLEPIRSLLMPLGWVGIGRVIGIPIALFMLWATWYVEHFIKSKAAKGLLREGKSPGEVIFLVTTSFCMTVTTIGMILYVLGAPTTDLWTFAGIGSTGILFWAWRYRTVVTKQA